LQFSPSHTLLFFRFRYYPSAHHAFLESNPDTLGVKLRNLLRVPLWQRAKRERAKSKRAQEEGEKVPTGTQKTWWTDDWLEGITSDLGNYPIICRVERTHAEFPPDPYSALKQIEKEGGEVKVTWTLPTMAATGGGKKIKNKTHMRLAVVLRALTPVVPPAWTGDVPVEEDSLGLPPNFTVVTAPASAAPFLIPFAWGYCITHSLSSGDQVAPISKADNKKGKICDFNSIGDEYGSFRLDDKMQIIRHVLGQLKNGSQLSVEAVEETVFAGLRSQSNLEFSDACAVVEILSGFMEGRASTSTDDAPSGQVNLLTLVRCTLPVLNGICVNDVYNRKKHYHSPWHLSVGKYKKSQKHANVPIITDAQEGPPRAFDDAMRFKIECTIDDFIKNNSDAEIFIPPVTDEIAPDYSCAVPISMCLQRVLSRLKVGKASSTGSRCYYTSIESVLFDLQAIADNCVLYNSPDSDVVEAALDLIPTAKKMISDVSNRHMKEQNARMKEEEGRRRLVLRQVDASALEQAVPNENNKSASTKRSKVSIIPGNLNAPCKAPLHKDWLQQIGPEGSWSLVPDETVDVSKWVPQSGDPIIYSRSLHTKFVKGHNSSMIEEQCVIPRFQLSEDYESPSEVATIAGNAEGQDGSINLNLLETIDTKWMKGTIAWARACFPRNPGKDVEETFAQNSPLLAIAIRFDYDWIKGGLFVVCWRPCMFCEDADAGQSVCETCGVSTETSFLRPGWAHINTEEIISSPLQPQTLSNASLGLPDIFRTSIGRCFDMLKRRCLNEIPTDYVDPNFCRENIKSGSNLALAKMGSRSLPSFQVSLEPKSIAISSSKTIATRGIRKTETEEPGNDLLSDVHYLPPWFPGPLLKAGTKKSAELPLYETMMPAPKISLELILLRVRSGYYRQLAALHNDIIEAYVASVLFVLSKPALRKKEPLSMRKIVRFMASPKGNSGAVSYSKTSKKKTPKANESTSAEAEEQLSEKQVSKSTSSLFSLNEEESQLVARIDKVRRLYATVSFGERVVDVERFKCLAILFHC
jgi:anti-sigma28 factor (negative regulator of flagellin synthesis)